MKCDFCGYVTKNNVRCSDGRTILKDAFKHCDGKKVPLFWRHAHDSIDNVLGHMILENREDGVFGYGFFNDSENGKKAKTRVEHGDIDAMSIWADQLVHDNNRGVQYGDIKEVSLVMAGANPEARIDAVSLQHEDGSLTELDDEAVIFNGHNIVIKEEPAFIKHEDSSKSAKKEEEDKKEDKGETVADVIGTLTDKQMKAVKFLIGNVVNDLQNEGEDDEEDNEIKHSAEGGEEMGYNVFEGTEGQGSNNVLSHEDRKAFLRDVIADAKKNGSLKDAFLAHAATYGIDNIDYLFPDARTVTNEPDFIKRDTDWVADVMANTKHTPFSRIKSVHADITADAARARGYVKGHRKVEEVITLLRRTTTPQTVYKKQKLDRDDVIDITDFDVVRWLRAEMRIMLDEEIARAILVGDGRQPDSDDKISSTNIRDIWTDDDIYTVKVPILAESTSGGTTTPISDEARAKAFIRAAIKSRKQYKGSGNPTAYITEDLLTECLLIEDSTGRTIYDTVEKLATKLRVNKIVSVPVMEDQVRAARTGADHSDETGYQFELGAIFVNLKDYNVGADKGGEVNMFDDFDINYNQMLYLIETRCSGALIKPHSAMVFEFKTTASEG